MAERPIQPSPPGETGKIILASACLLGVKCRFDGGESQVPELLRLGEGIVPVCPEILGGLGVPRPPAEFVGGDGEAALCGRAKIVNSCGVEVTANFLRGAEAGLEIARRLKINQAVLKDKSPSCGIHKVYIAGKLEAGCGVFAALLLRAGVELLLPEEAVLRLRP